MGGRSNQWLVAPSLYGDGPMTLLHWATGRLGEVTLILHLSSWGALSMSLTLELLVVKELCSSLQLRSLVLLYWMTLGKGLHSA